MEGSGNDFKLLFSGKLHKVNGVAGNSDGELWIFFWMFHGFEEGFFVENVHIQMLSTLRKVTVQQSNQILNFFLWRTSKCRRYYGEGI